MISPLKIHSRPSPSYGILSEGSSHELLVRNLIFGNCCPPVEVTETIYTGEEDQASLNIPLFENRSLNKLVPLDGCSEIGQITISLPPLLPAKSPVKMTLSLSDYGRLSIICELSTGQRTEVLLEIR